jgi:hypothetical protein
MRKSSSYGLSGFNRKKTLFTSKLDLNLGKKLVNCYVLKCMMLKLGHFGKWIRNTWNVLKCGGEGLKGSVGPIV